MTRSANADPSRAVTDTELALAAADADLALVAAEVVLQASREVKLVTRNDVFVALVANGVLSSGKGVEDGKDSRGTCQVGAGSGSIERQNALDVDLGGSGGSPHGDTDVRPPMGGNIDAWLTAVLSSHPGIASFESLSGQTVYHAPDLLSRTYALILDRKGAPVALMAGEIRANCRDYPRPVPVELFESPPFELSPEEIESALRSMAASPDYKDITFTATSTGAVYLFSTLHMERGYAAFLAERAENLAMNP